MSRSVAYGNRLPVRKLIVLGVLLMLLAAASWVLYYFSQNKTLPLPTASLAAGEILPPPTFLYNISGTGKNALGRPVGVAIGKDQRVYVSDSTRNRISVFTHDGTFLFAFDKIAAGKEKKLKAPVHIAFDSNGELYVTDRILDAVYVFDTEGKFLREWQPADKAVMKNWSPLGITFGPDQRMYLSDVGDTEKHKMLVFDPTSRAKLLQWGKTAMVEHATEGPGDFYFPNGIAVAKNGLIFVADGNNRRVQVFDKTGAFKQFINTSGIPRGIWVDEANQRVIVSDALSHSVDIYSLKGQKLVSFGTGGSNPGQFQFPNDVALDSAGRIFIADRENHQVQVWGWSDANVPPVVAEVTQRWYWCLSPLALLPLLLLSRRRRYLLTPDFVDALVAMDEAALMDQRRIRWIAPEADHAAHYEGRMEAGLDLGQMIEPEPYSQSDVRALMERLGSDERTAIVLSMAERAKRLCTQDPELRRLATLMDIDVLDCEQFAERYRPKRG